MDYACIFQPKITPQEISREHPIRKISKIGTFINYVNTICKLIMYTHYVNIALGHTTPDFCLPRILQLLPLIYHRLPLRFFGICIQA